MIQHTPCLLALALSLTLGCSAASDSGRTGSSADVPAPVDVAQSSDDGPELDLGPAEDVPVPVEDVPDVTQPDLPACVEGVAPDDPCLVCTCDEAGVQTCAPAAAGDACLPDEAADCCFEAPVCTACPADAPCADSGMVCQAAPKLDCLGGGQCVVRSAVCSDGTCACQDAPVDDGAACTLDPPQCSVGDYCLSGVCTAGTPADLEDGDPCTTGKCVDGAVAQYPNSGSCDDGDPCTIGESCSDGVCGGGAQDSCDDADDCTTDSCEAGVGCAHEPIEDCPALDTFQLVPGEATSTDKVTAAQCPGGGDVTHACPDGAVAVGYEGKSGAFMDHFVLKCRTLQPDGTLGEELFTTSSLGSSLGGSSFGPIYCPDGMALVGSDTYMGDKLDGIAGHCQTIAAVASGTPGWAQLAAKGGGSGGSLTVQPCPTGSVVVGMSGDGGQYPCSLQWTCHPVTQ